MTWHYSLHPLQVTACLEDFCRPAAVLNLKQPAEIVLKKTKTGNNLLKFKDCRNVNGDLGISWGH
jgi:hypothetical protein